MAEAAILGGGLLSATGGIFGGLAANEESKRQAKLAKLQGRFQERADRQDTRQLQGAIVNRSSTAGTGSSLDIEAESAFEGELAALLTRFGAKKQASAARRAGRSAMISGFIGAGSSLLSSAGTAALLQPTPVAGAGGGSGIGDVGGNAHLLRFSNTA